MAINSACDARLELTRAAQTEVDHLNARIIDDCRRAEQDRFDNAHYLPRHSGGTGETPPPAELELTLEHLAGRPEPSGFLTVDQMTEAVHQIHAAYPEITDLNTVGFSKRGEPLWELIVYRRGRHDTARQALVVGGVHSNEPIGNNTSIELAHLMCTDARLREKLGLTWRIIPCIDPDAMRLNESWLTTWPFPRARYGGEYRSRDQPCWTLPVSYTTKDGRTLSFAPTNPETKTLMRVIDTHRDSLALIFELHNAEAGAPFFLVSRDCSLETYRALEHTAKALRQPPRLVPDEQPDVSPYAHGVYPCSTRTSILNFSEQHGLPLPDTLSFGTSVAEYAGHDILTAQAEAPLRVTSEPNDFSPTGTPYRVALREAAARWQEDVGYVTATYDAVKPHLTDSIHLRDLAPYLASCADNAGEYEAMASVAQDRMATVAELYSAEYLLVLFRARYGGMLVRAIEDGMGDNPHPVVLDHLADLRQRYEIWADHAEATGGAVVPIRDAVALQLASGLIFAKAATDDSPR